MRPRVSSRIALLGVLSVAVIGSAATLAPSAAAGGASAASTFHFTQFRSPSRNIGCYILGGTARCDISHRNWSPPPHPAWCPKQVGFGQGLIVGRTGNAHFVCAGDTALDPSGQALPYGSTDRVGVFSCSSATTGVTCTNTRTSRGFFISIQSYRIF